MRECVQSYLVFFVECLFEEYVHPLELPSVRKSVPRIGRKQLKQLFEQALDCINNYAQVERVCQKNHMVAVPYSCDTHQVKSESEQSR